MFSLPWSKLFRIEILIIIVTEVYSLDIPTEVSISKWTSPENIMNIACSVSAPTKPGNGFYNVHLFCPFIGGSSCYVNCNSQCLQETGECNKNDLKQIFYSCNFVTNERKIDLYFQLNMKHINISGEWFCEYGGQRSSMLNIDKFVHLDESTTKSTKKTTTSTVPFFSTTLQNFFPNFDMRTVIIIIISLGLSILVNVVLITLVCVTRRSFQKTRRQMKKKEMSKDITETTSMLTRSSTHQQMLNRSNCSRTPSLDSPSFRESIPTYLPEGSTIISANMISREPHQYYVDQCGRFVGVLQPLSNFNLDSADILSRHSSGESASGFISGIHGNIVIPQRVVTHGSNLGNWSHVVSQHQDSFSSTRACSSQRQIYMDSNDESGLGSQSLSHSTKQKHGSFHSGSDKVDLILDCDPNLNNVSRPALNVQ